MSGAGPPEMRTPPAGTEGEQSGNQAGDAISIDNLTPLAAGQRDLLRRLR